MRFPPDIPKAFVQQMEHWLGAEARDLVAALSDKPWRGLRYASVAKPHGELPKSLAPFLGDGVPWAADGFYLAHGPSLGYTVLHQAGAFYLQDPSAMAVAVALDPQPGERILDLCAAPGGKTTHAALLAARRGGAQIVANDIHRDRVLALAENAERVGAPCAITNESPAALAEAWPQAFDAMVVDAPCSGEGMFRKDPAVRAEWRPDAPERFQALQKDILHHALTMLRPGGRLVYSTCTLNPLENEQVVLWLLDHYPVELEPLPDWPEWRPARSDWAADREDIRLAKRLWPHVGRGEGHFVARFRLCEPVAEKPRRRSKGATATPAGKAWDAWLASLLTDVPPAWRRTSIHKTLVFADALGDLAAPGLRVLRPGPPLAERKGQVFVPHHAASRLIPPGGFRATVEIDEETAIRYLAGEPLAAPDGLCPEASFCAVAHEGFHLGFAKRAPGRLNNLYPRGLRSTRVESLAALAEAVASSSS
ncbi:methyltransferase RsmF C-terminal domain-like protein [Alicyclobacillus acidocaldarius]|uniref:Fmu (Sun) domain protein n=1 Tax=Alicyclobacillus acidocaldarius subsp. acidocaldarius (strain ATCC 27009 / DSM 446 / BCRC 14685 / JCM 5260 / KCTC 1825 / NBRC 15652 / NCIMB 11725 / NRRL B-14509 / 104-IA) TaxID=521098 RepID=C8WQC9_ALIAD|nr:RNA methyltransferase [Alicyclobacillus acidocaldarius]ACV59074.1 Fmu (Sun) domain protein [Alicyclobacillus acidocaldarius subsp. acidocaldarius DSM 446]